MNKRSLDFNSMVEFADMEEKLTGQDVNLTVDGGMSFMQCLDGFEVGIVHGAKEDFISLGGEEYEDNFMIIPFSKIKYISSETPTPISEFDTYYIQLTNKIEITLLV
ncbi:MAG: hypothetical protein ABF633_01625 [Clostridium sp.]|uniref:hypothetical protein n=1 Tax=Clostridium sp. TaxID=1506 RepID=UPI0039ED4B3E